MLSALLQYNLSEHDAYSKIQKMSYTDENYPDDQRL